MLNKLACHLRYSLIVVVIVVVVIMFSRWTGKSTTALVATTLAAPSMAVDVRTVVAEAAAANYSAHTQPNRLDALVDVTSALATLSTASALAGKDSVTQAAGVPVYTLQQELGAHQRQLLLELQSHSAPPAQAPGIQPLPKISGARK
jgi:hypothetical protein